MEVFFFPLKKKTPLFNSEAERERDVSSRGLHSPVAQNGGSQGKQKLQIPWRYLRWVGRANSTASQSTLAGSWNLEQEQELQLRDYEARVQATLTVSEPPDQRSIPAIVLRPSEIARMFVLVTIICCLPEHIETGILMSCESFGALLLF